MNITFIVLVRLPGREFHEHTKPLTDRTQAEQIAQGILDSSPEAEVKIVQHVAGRSGRKGRRG